MCAGAKQRENWVYKSWSENFLLLIWGFWNLRAAQGYWRVAPFCEQAVGVVSGKCASRGLLWRGAQEENLKVRCIT
ncbi:hypothetical protein A2U01_0078314, partial [Trifolium medium]|nr:hypothetical protein [Trifolium medium]